MTAIAVELDQKLRELDPKTAASVEQLVCDALNLAEQGRANGSSWPPGFWQQIRNDWGTEPFERLPQDEFENHEDRTI